MSTYERQLRSIRIAIDRYDLQLCHLGNADEWVVLGLLTPTLPFLPRSPNLRYSEGRWACSHPTLASIITQAIGDQRNENSVRGSAPQHGAIHRANCQQPQRLRG